MERNSMPEDEWSGIEQQADLSFAIYKDGECWGREEDLEDAEEMLFGHLEVGLDEGSCSCCGGVVAYEDLGGRRCMNCDEEVN